MRLISVGYETDKKYVIAKGREKEKMRKGTKEEMRLDESQCSGYDRKATFQAAEMVEFLEAIFEAARRLRDGLCHDSQA